MTKPQEYTRRFHSSLEQIREAHPLPGDPFTERESEHAKRLLESLQGLEEAEYVELAIHFPSAWTRILPLAYRLVAEHETTEIRSLVFRLMRQQMGPSLLQALWLMYQDEWYLTELGDFLLPYLAEHDDHFRGQASIPTALSFHLQRFSNTRILDQEAPAADTLSEWAALFDLDLTRSLGANILGESALLWHARHYRIFAETLFAAIPAMDPLLAAQLVRTAFTPHVLTEDLRQTAYHALRPTYETMRDGSEMNFWSYCEEWLKEDYSRWVIRRELELQFSSAPVKAELLVPLEQAIRHVHRPDASRLIIDLGSHLLVDAQAYDNYLMLIDKMTMRRLLEQGRSVKQLIENLTTARFWGESATQEEGLPEGRWRLGTTDAWLGITRKLLNDIATP